MIKRYVFGSVLTFLIASSFAANALPTSTTQLPKTLSLPGQPVFQLKTIRCPSPKDLVKDTTTNRWSALKKWHGTTQSLATKADKFLGAQWQGINLGQPFCIYSGVPSGTFNIVLAYHTFSITPRGGRWQDMHHQIYKCFSHDRSQCLYQVRLKPKTLTIDQQIDQIKPGGGNDSMNNRGF